ncbi:MAG: 16S rRNA (uracil(1498)-N(3))-methyltransferase [Prevotella sp.]
MKEVRYFYVPDAALQNELPQEETIHAVRVLRLVSGDEIYLMDGCGTFYRAAVTLAAQRHCGYEILETLPQDKEWRGNIHIAMAPTKMIDRTEWFCEKATEIGIDTFTFLNSKFSERKALRTDRIEKIVVSAMKQSRKSWKPQVNPLTDFSDFIKMPFQGRRYIAHCYEEIERRDLFQKLNVPLQPGESEDVTVMIGPEGDFSIEEVKDAVSHGYVSVSLGTCRLRTETAALAATMMSQLVRRV